MGLTSPFTGVTGGAPAGTSVGKVITDALPFVFAAASMLLLVYLVMGGLQLMTSKGDPKAIQSAQGKITNALIGFVIVIIAASLVLLAGQLLKINVFSTIF